MKITSILFPLTLLFALNLQAASSYKDIQYGKYVSIAHLHYVFNKVKKTSNITQKALAKTFHYYEKNRYTKHLSPNFLAIADYTKSAFEKRLYIINLHTAKVNQYMVAHGVNSGGKGDRVWSASNEAGSYKTPTGFFKVGSQAGITTRKRYDYLSIDGLEWKNRNAKQREIILHTASYVASVGRSRGCFAIKPEDRWQVFSRMKRALLLSYTGN